MRTQPLGASPSNRAAMRRLVALLYCSIHARGDEIVSIVTTAEGFERGATARQLPAYDLYNRAVHAADK